MDQAELEAHDGVAPGKYTLGLGQVLQAATDLHLHLLLLYNTALFTQLLCYFCLTQWLTAAQTTCCCCVNHCVGMQTAMAFYGDQENAVSAALTAVQRLLERHKLDPRSIGR